MKEAISFFVMLVIVLALYEYMKPKNDYQSTNQHKDTDDKDDYWSKNRYFLNIKKCHAKYNTHLL